MPVAPVAAFPSGAMPPPMPVAAFPSPAMPPPLPPLTIVLPPPATIPPPLPVAPAAAPSPFSEASLQPLPPPAVVHQAFDLEQLGVSEDPSDSPAATTAGGAGRRHQTPAGRDVASGTAGADQGPPAAKSGCTLLLAVLAACALIAGLIMALVHLDDGSWTTKTGPAAAVDAAQNENLSAVDEGLAGKSLLGCGKELQLRAFSKRKQQACDPIRLTKLATPPEQWNFIALRSQLRDHDTWLTIQVNDQTFPPFTNPDLFPVQMADARIHAFFADTPQIQLGELLIFAQRCSATPTSGPCEPVQSRSSFQWVWAKTLPVRAPGRSHWRPIPRPPLRQRGLSC